MRVVIITGTAPHHKYLCAELTREFDVVGIIHPAEPVVSAAGRLRRYWRYVRSEGWALVGMHLLGKFGAHFSMGNFSEGVAAYTRIPASLIHERCDIRQAGPILLRSLRPDLTLCLGGPVYPRALIEASPLMLNFHSGISPFYNGTASILFAFANGHPHLCGGTLMVMSTEVDGGRILAHYLPEVESGDTPGSLFGKTVRGATLMYQRLLKCVEASDHGLQSVSQPAPIFYTRGIDLTWYHHCTIARHLRRDLPARFERTETFAEYWRQPTPEAARQAYDTLLVRLLWETKGLDKHRTGMTEKTKLSA